MRIPQSVIQASVSEVLETMYFMSPVYCGQTPLDCELFEVEVEFRGDRTGRFHMQVSRRLAVSMASDFLACEPGELPPDQVEATVKELANVACGASMSAWMPTLNFEYGVPHWDEAPMAGEGHAFAVASGPPQIAFEVTLLN